MLQNILTHLSARLPELEWQLSQLPPYINSALLPRGLFKDKYEITPKDCMNEIKSDLLRMQTLQNDNSTHYLAERVEKKINVLVRLCQKSRIKKPERHTPFGVKALSTRQQWLKSLEADVSALNAQHAALTQAYNILVNQKNTTAALSLYTELNIVARSLTTAQETLARSVMS